MTQEGKKNLKELGKELVDTIFKKKQPVLKIPVRSLSNVVFNKKTQSLQLGNKKADRNFFNISHAKKFLQTIEVAAVSKELVETGKHASLRDVFYQVKRTIPNTNINKLYADEIVQAFGYPKLRSFCGFEYFLRNFYKFRIIDSFQLAVHVQIAFIS